MSDYMSEEKLAEMADEGDILKSEEDTKYIKNYLTEEITKVLSGAERGAFIEKVQKWRRQREARPETEEKTFPWTGASNVSVPIGMITANGVYTYLKASLGQRKPFWSVESEDQDFADGAKALELFIDALAESRYHLNLHKANNEILYNVGSLGTQFVKIPWITEMWNFKRSGDSGTETVARIKRDSPVLIPLRMEDYVSRPYWGDIQRAPWFSHRIHLFEHELEQREAWGIYENLETVFAHGPTAMDDEMVENLRRMGVDPEVTGSGSYDIHEAYLYFDVDGDGVPEDIIIWFHPETGTILRSEFNDLGIRPMVKLSYFDRPGELYGMGTGWMVEHLQDEIDALHNMRVDGTQLAMLQMYITRRGSGIGPGERFRPLKQIAVDDPKNDFIPVKFQDIGYGTLQAEMMAKEYADRATLISDTMMGFENKAIGTRATASGTAFLAGKSASGLDAIRENIEDGYSAIGQILNFQLIRNRDKVLEYIDLIPTEYHQALTEVLSMSVEDIPTRFRFKVRTTEAEETEEVKRQNLLTLTQLYSMYGQQVFQLLPMVYGKDLKVPPEIKIVAAKFFTGATELMTNIFKFFGEGETKKYLPYVKNLQMMLQAIEAQQSQKAQQIGGPNVSAYGREVRGPGEGHSGAGPSSGFQRVEPGPGAVGDSSGGP